MTEKHHRTLAKTLSWRVIATVTTATLVFIFTGDLGLSMGIGMLEVVSKLVFYYAHERAWSKVTWGRGRQ